MYIIYSFLTVYGNFIKTICLNKMEIVVSCLHLHLHLNMLPLEPMVHPRYIRYARQALLFACVWMLFGFVYSILEKGMLGDLDHYPATTNKYDFYNSLIYSSLGGFIVGFVQGWIEVSWLNRSFEKRPLWMKLVLKLVFYLAFIVIFLILLSMFVNSKRFNASPFSAEVLESLEFFIYNFSFWSVIIYVAFGVVIATLFAELSSYLGGGIFLNFLRGKYHHPKKEVRIFMFLDMKSSTTIAEQIGHERYFELLKDCYADMANPILETSGEIYQYVGDEIVVSWTERIGLYQNNCIECFLRILAAFEQRKEDYEKKFNLFPTFKAGYHLGLVTTGEIGIIKKDIIYTGDVLNTASRIQSECNTYNTKLLISKHLVTKLESNGVNSWIPIADIKLRGKNESIQLYSMEQYNG